MIMNLDFDALCHSQQVSVSPVIAETRCHNGMLSRFEHAHSMLARTALGAPFLGGIEDRTAKCEYLSIVSSAAGLNNCLARDAGAARCEVSLQLMLRVSDGTAWHRHWELRQERLRFAWDIHRYFFLMANATDPVTRKWLAPGSCWICICFVSFLPPEWRPCCLWGSERHSRLPLTPIKQWAHRAGRKEVRVPVSHFSIWGEGKVLILQKRLSKKTEGGEKKKDYSHRPRVPREACLGD